LRAEGGLDPVGDGVREVAADDAVAVAAARPGLLERLVAGIEEEPVPRMGRAVERKQVVRALLEDEDPGRVLAPRVDAVAVPADAPVALDVRHLAVARAP